MKKHLPAFARSALLLPLALLPAARSSGDSKDTWVEVRSPDFVVASNAGEKQARHVAREFEEIRSIYHDALPKLRLDLGKPIIILAAKNENSTKALLPEEWEAKGHIHHAGMYVQEEDKHYVLLQLGAEGENPYHVLYHEYTHAILHVNFPPLPLWLDEGLAELYGNTTIGDKESVVGKPDSSHLALLQQSKLIPIETLLQVDHTSPFYNEQNRASVFYAESWALVHFLLMDPEARKENLFGKFVDSWNKSGDQVDAAKQTFGDLKRFGQKVEAYARQERFYAARVKSLLQVDEKSYASRMLPEPESLAVRGDFHLHRGRMPEAKAMLDQAAQEDGKLPLVHEALGLYYFRQRDMENAAKELQRATELDSKSFLTYYFSAMLNLQEARGSQDAWPQTEASLEKAIALNPNFAPAYGSLSSLYAIRKETQDKALAAARRAMQLEPGTLGYAVNLGYVLLNMGKQDEAKALAARISAAAKTPAEVAMAQAFQTNVQTRAEFESRLGAVHVRQRQQDDTESAERPAASTGANAPSEKSNLVASSTPPLTRRTSGEIPEESPAAAPAAVTDARVYEMSGTITSVDCSHAREVTLTISMSGIAMKLHAADIGKLGKKAVSTATEPSGSEAKSDASAAQDTAATGKPAAIPGNSGASAARAAAACAAWKGRSAKMSYHLTPGQSVDGEIVSVQFF
jgi:tetratricopeptide (TPR) repeat protein